MMQITITFPFDGNTKRALQALMNEGDLELVQVPDVARPIVKRRRWTSIEDKILTQCVHNGRDWYYISVIMKENGYERTPAACQTRWFKYLIHEDE